MRIVRFAYVFLPSFAFLYYVLMRSGLSGGSSVPTAAEAFYSLPLLLCSFLLVGAVFAELFLNMKGTATGTVLWTLGVTIMAAGYWTSALSRFDIVTVITEGQTLGSENIERIPGAGYVGKFAHSSGLDVELVRLHPVFTSDGTVLNSIEGEFVLRTYGKEQLYRISNTVSRFIGPARLKIRDMGYSPLYELRTKGDNLFDSSFVYLKIFPPGREDSFRLLAPLTYYLRYYPEGNADGDPSLHVRIARNKDIVFDADVEIGEEIGFENVRMKFPEVRRWTLLEIRKDYGLPVFWLGTILGIFGLAIRFKKTKGSTL